jgi:outer membrane protein OmpA-like peptidoglycan-associated protein
MPEPVGQHQAVPGFRPESPVSISGPKTKKEEDVKRRFFPVPVLLALLPTLALAFQAIGGGCGLFRVQDVKSEGYGWLTFTEHSLFRAVEKQYMVEVPVGIAYAPADWMELMFSPGYAVGVDSLQLGTDPYVHVIPIIKKALNGVNTWTDMRVGSKLGLTLLPVIKLGVQGFYQFATRDEAKQFRDHPLLAGKCWGGKGLAALNFKDLLPTVPFNFIANYGYTKGGYYDAIAPAQDTVWNSLGLGFELPARSFAVFVEANSEFRKGEKPFGATSFIHITPGARFRFGFGLGVDAGLDFGMGATAPKQTYLVGLNLASPVGRPAAKPLGSVTGTIVDYRSGAPLSATLILPDTKIYKNKPVIVGDNGAFKLDKLPVGSVVIEVSKEAYQRATATVVVEKDKTSVYDFRLRTLKQYGTITGRVLDATSKNPVRGTISFPDSVGLPMAAADTMTGVFTAASIPVGTIAITASAPGYLTETKPVVVEDGKVTNTEFQLRPAMEFGSVSGTVTDASNNKPVKAEISFADPSLPKVMTDEATGFYKADKIPTGVNVVKVAADGYFTAQATVTIEANKATAQSFTLNPAVQNGELTGMVKDKTSKNPLKAVIYFPNSQVASVMSDSGTGFFKAAVPVGATVVACSLPGYAKQLSQTPVIVKKDEPAIYNFEMLRIGTEITISADAIHFAFNSAEIQPEGYPALNEWVKLMKDSPFMTAEIQGHTDAVGSESYNMDLSNRRAASVVDYLASQGVERARLTPVGYGESRLIEQTQERSETNRRVVFKVTGEIKKQ